MMPYGKQPRAAVLWRAPVNNSQLVEVVTRVGRASAADARWPDNLNANDAAFIAWQYVRQRSRYYPDRGDQYVRTPRAFVREGIGDCKTTAVFIAAMAHAAGHRAALKFVTLPGRRHFGHVYAMVDGVAFDPLLHIGEEVLHSQSYTAEI